MWRAARKLFIAWFPSCYAVSALAAFRQPCQMTYIPAPVTFSIGKLIWTLVTLFYLHIRYLHLRAVCLLNATTRKSAVSLAVDC